MEPSATAVERPAPAAGVPGPGPIHRCPKCAARFDPPRAAASECPACGVWFHKWNAPIAQAPAPIPFDEEPQPAAAPDSLTYWGRAGTLLFVAAWGAYLASLDYSYNAIGQSFMHAIVLPIHEAGHVLFRPFGEFMTVLGGSLFQVALPFSIGVAFLWRQHDAFGAAMCLWWTGASLVDLAPYIWDSLDPQIVLLGGRTGEDGGHDWIYLLGRFNAIAHAHGYGAFVHHLGTLLMVAAVGWGIRWLVERRLRAKEAS